MFSKESRVLEIVDQKESMCGDLALLQRSVVQGVELVCGLVLEENAAGREKEVPQAQRFGRWSRTPECVPAIRSFGPCGRPLPGVLSS